MEIHSERSSELIFYLFVPLTGATEADIQMQPPSLVYIAVCLVRSCQHQTNLVANTKSNGNEFAEKSHPDRSHNSLLVAHGIIGKSATVTSPRNVCLGEMWGFSVQATTDGDSKTRPNRQAGETHNDMAAVPYTLLVDDDYCY